MYFICNIDCIMHVKLRQNLYFFSKNILKAEHYTENQWIKSFPVLKKKPQKMKIATTSIDLMPQNTRPPPKKKEKKKTEYGTFPWKRQKKISIYLIKHKTLKHLGLHASVKTCIKAEQH